VIHLNLPESLLPDRHSSDQREPHLILEKYPRRSVFSIAMMTVSSTEANNYLQQCNASIADEGGWWGSLARPTMMTASVGRRTRTTPYSIADAKKAAQGVKDE
jgi:hypothetical protein